LFFKQYNNIIMKIKTAIEILHSYIKLNHKLKNIYDDLIGFNDEDTLDDYINAKQPIKNNNLDLINALNFLLGVELYNDEQYFDINFHYSTLISNNFQENYIEVRSNYLNLKLVFENIIGLSDIFIFNYNNSRIDIIDTILNNEKTFNNDNRKVKLNKSYFLNYFSDQSIKIYGSESDIELFYDFIFDFLNEVNNYEKKRKIYKQILSGLYFASESMKSKSITYLLDENWFLSNYSKLDCINDLKSIDLLSFTYDDLFHIYNNLKKINFNSPNYYFNLISERLTPKEEIVLKLRYKNEYTLDQVGKKFNLTRERIRQIELNGIERFISNKKFILFCNSLSLNCGNKWFFSSYDLIKNDLDVSFIKKVYPKILENSLDDTFYFYDNYFLSFVCKFIESLPEIILTEDLYKMVDTFFEDNFKGLNSIYIKKFIINKYYNYAKYSSRRKLKHNIVVALLMQKYFPDGIDPYNDESIEKIRKFAKNEFNYELSENTRAITSIIQNTCILCDRGRWKYSENSIILSEKFLKMIIDFISNYNISSVPISYIYTSFEDSFNEIGIINRYSLQGVLKRSLSNKYIITRDYVLKHNASSLYNEIEDYISNSSHIVTIDELKKYFPGFSYNTLNSITEKTDILNMNGYYVNIKSLNITTEIRNFLFYLIKESVNDGFQHHSKELFYAIKEKMNGFFNSIGMNHYLQFYYLTEKMFKDQFNFQRPFIALKDVSIVSSDTLLLDTIIKKGVISLKELRSLSYKTGYYLDGYIEYVERHIDSIIFKNQTSVLSVSQLDIDTFDSEKFDLILQHFLAGSKCKVLYSFTNYCDLPYIGIEWNSWVLYSFILKFSQKFYAITTSAIIKKAIPIILEKGYKLDESIIKYIENLNCDINEINTFLNKFEGKNMQIDCEQKNYDEFLQEDNLSKKIQNNDEKNIVINNGYLKDTQPLIKRIPWDKYETALLIEAFWKIENKNGNRIEVLTSLSRDLRQKAVNQGKKIDDKFRNYNGMSLQLVNLESVFFPNRTSINNKTAIFEEIADLYKNDQQQFNILLKEAHRLVDQSHDTVDKSELFFDIDFNDKLDLSFTQPKSVIYFDKQEFFFDSWTDCYRYLIKCIYEDYPDVILSLANDPSYSLISKEANLLRRPIAIGENVFAEANRCAIDLMKHIKNIFDKCGIDYENIMIKYSRKDNSIKQNKYNYTYNNIIETKEEIYDVSDYNSVIQTEFPNGYAFTNPLRKNTFKKRYLEIIGKEFSDDLNLYYKKINQVGFISEEKVYLPTMVTDETKNEIRSFIDSSLETLPIICYSKIYQKFNEKLSSEFSEDMLKKYIEFSFKDNYIFNDEFLSFDNKNTNIKKFLVEIFLNCGCPLSIEELHDKLPNISLDAIRKTIVNDKDFIVNSLGKSYFYKENFLIDDEELEIIKSYLIIKIQEKEFVTGKELFAFINNRLHNLIESNYGVTELGFKNILKLKFSNEFKFQRDFISTNDQNYEVSKMFKEFCQQRKNFSITELKEFRDSINLSNIDWNEVFTQSIRINNETFIRRDLINFDTKKIDNALSLYFIDDYISFNDVYNFTDFPSIGYSWNIYILESYLFVNNDNFILIHKGFNEDKPIGGIVKITSSIKKFDDLIIKIIKDEKLFDKEKALNFLFEKGFIKVRRIENIDLLIAKAKKEG